MQRKNEKYSKPKISAKEVFIKMIPFFRKILGKSPTNNSNKYFKDKAEVVRTLIANPKNNDKVPSENFYADILIPFFKEWLPKTERIQKEKKLQVLVDEFDEFQKNSRNDSDLLYKPVPQTSARKAIYETFPPIIRNNRPPAIPLSDGQFRLAFLEHLNEDFSCYNWLIAFKIDQDLNHSILEKSILYLIRRHESLRTGIHLDTRTQTILPFEQVSWGLEVIEIDLYEEDELSFIKDECAQFGQLKMSLEHPPLIRSKLIVYNKNGRVNNLWLCAVHHAVFDGYSQSIFLHELGKCYQILAQGLSLITLDTVFGELPVQYADYCAWTRNFPTTLLEDEVLYWRYNLRDHKHLELATDQPRPATKTFVGSRALFEIPKEIADRLKKISVSTNATLYMILLASFQCLLHLYTNEMDICTGSVTANRKKGKAFEQIKNIIGFFANTVAVRTLIKPDMTIAEVIHAVAQSVRHSIYDNSDLPFGEVVSRLKPPQDNKNPFFETLFVLQDPGYQTLELPNIATRSIELGWETSRFDLVLELREHEGQLVGFFEYNTDLFVRETIERMVGNYRELLQDFDNLSKRVAQLNVRSAYEKQLFESFNPPINWNLQLKTVPEAINHIVQIFPDKNAIIFEKQTLTYKELDHLSEKVAAFILNRYGKGTIIGLYMERSFEVVASMLGVIKAGCAVICLDTNPVDIASAVKKITTLKIPCVICHPPTEQFFNETMRNVPLEHAMNLVEWHSIETGSPRSRSHQCLPDDIIYLSTTSGTTGNPKGIPTTHRGWVNWIDFFRRESETYNLNSADLAVYLGAALTFDASFWEILLTLGLGGTLYINDTLKYRDPVSLSDLFQLHGINVATFTPSFLINLDPTQFRTLRCLFCIGEVLSQELVRRWTATIPDLKFINGYGPTEVTAGATLSICHPLRPINIGKPIANMNIHIAGSYLRDMPIGCFGEILISGVSLSPGYLNNPEKTREAFIDHPYYPGRKFYRTGELGRFLASGEIEFKGRLSVSRQIKLKGVRIELDEIEAILNTFPSLMQSFVKLIPAEYPFLAAYYVTANNQDIADFELQQFLAHKGLITVKIPSAFVRLDKFPLTSNGKLDEKLLPPIRTHNYLVPFEEEGSPSKTALQILELMSQIFPSKEISMDSNFWDLGGDSIQLVILLNAINKKIIRENDPKLCLAPMKVRNLTIAVLEDIVTTHIGKEGYITSAKSMNDISRAVYRSPFSFTSSQS